MLTPKDVFTPNAHPEHNYVPHPPGIEEKAHHALDQRGGAFVLISGAPKSGKSTLIRRLASDRKEHAIPVPGNRLSTDRTLFDLALDYIGVAHSQWIESGEQHHRGATKSADVRVSVSGIGAGAGASSSEYSTIKRKAGGELKRASTADLLARALGDRRAFVYLDKLHYVDDEDLLVIVARDISDAVDCGLKVVATSLNDQSSELTAGCPELAGLVHVPLGVWPKESLRMIAINGLRALNLVLDDASLEAFVDAAQGSPQAMHTICSEVCSHHGIDGSLPQLCRLELTENERMPILQSNAPSAIQETTSQQKRTWYYESAYTTSTGSEYEGPVTRQELMRLAVRGAITPNTKIRQRGDESPSLASKLLYPRSRRPLFPTE